MAENDGARTDTEDWGDLEPLRPLLADVHRVLPDWRRAAGIVRAYRDREVAAALAEQAGVVERLRPIVDASLALYEEGGSERGIADFNRVHSAWAGHIEAYLEWRAALGAAPGRGTEEGANGGG